MRTVMLSECQFFGECCSTSLCLDFSDACEHLEGSREAASRTDTSPEVLQLLRKWSHIIQTVT